MSETVLGEPRIDNNYETENIRPYFEDELVLRRLRYPKTPEDSATIIAEIAKMAEDGKHIALVDGSYDVPQPNHQWYLQYCRLLAAKHNAERLGLDEDDPQRLAASDDVVLVVTLDTDQKIARIKNGRHGERAPTRPIYPWPLRAQYIANFMTPVGGNRFRPIVDLITIDGDEPEAGTPHESHLSFGAALLERGALHSWLFYGEHNNKRNQANDLITLSRQTDCRTIGIDAVYCVDETGRPWHSTTIIDKILGIKTDVSQP